MLETGVNIRQFLQLQDGSLLIASTEKYIQMWDIQKLKSKITDLHGHSLCVRQMIQINNSSFVSSGDDQYLIFWDIPTRSQRKKVNIQCQCWKLLLLKDNTFVAAGANTAPSFFNINGENVEKRGVTGSSYITSACEFDKYIVCGANSRVLVLEKDTGELVKEYTKNMKSFVRVAFNLQ
jgi:WD40 repeat protein